MKPGSKKPSIEKKEDGSWVVRVRERALEGKANAAVIVAVAKELDVARSKVRLVIGETSRNKVVEVDL